jgi:hypothetical protein
MSDRGFICQDEWNHAVNLPHGIGITFKCPDRTDQHLNTILEIQTPGNETDHFRTIGGASLEVISNVARQIVYQ